MHSQMHHPESRRLKSTECNIGALCLNSGNGVPCHQRLHVTVRCHHRRGRSSSTLSDTFALCIHYIDNINCLGRHRDYWFLSAFEMVRITVELLRKVRTFPARKLFLKVAQGSTINSLTFFFSRPLSLVSADLL